MPKIRRGRLFDSIVVAMLAAASTHGQAVGMGAHDPRLFECADDGLSRRGSTGFGCQLLATRQITRFPDGPLFWHLTKLPTRDTAPSASGHAFVVEAAGQEWLFSFGPKDAAPNRGEILAFEHR